MCKSCFVLSCLDCKTSGHRAYFIVVFFGLVLVIILKHSISQRMLYAVYHEMEFCCEDGVLLWVIMNSVDFILVGAKPGDPLKWPSLPIPRIRSGNLSSA